MLFVFVFVVVVVVVIIAVVVVVVTIVIVVMLENINFNLMKQVHRKNRRKTKLNSGQNTPKQIKREFNTLFPFVCVGVGVCVGVVHIKSILCNARVHRVPIGHREEALCGNTK